MTEKVNLDEYFEKFHDTFSPKIVGELNGQHVKLVRCEGDKIPWHIHDDEDEMFFVVEGTLDILERDRTVSLRAGEFYIVQRGVDHRIFPHGHVKLMLFEPAGIAHTGKVKTEITQEHPERLCP